MSPVIKSFARVVCGLLFVPALLIAAPRDAVPLYESARLTKNAPAVDGVLDDAAWQGVTRAPIQRQHHDEEPVAEGARNVGYWMATWDEENLYLGMRVIDEHVNEGQAKLYEPHNDVVELFFDPLLNYQFNLQYRVWPFGTSGGPGEVSQDPTWGRWEVASTRTPDGYLTEVRVPLSHFMEVAQVDLRAGSLIGFDLSVHDIAFPTDEQWAPPKVTGWAGDGTNWQYASQNGLLALGAPSAAELAAVRPHQDDIGETPEAEAMALWPELGLVSGFFNLDVLRQSWSTDSFQPWRLGRVRHPLIDRRNDRDTRAVNRTVGPHAHGEALEVRPRVVELTLAGERDGRAHELTVLTTPFHPAMSYRTSSSSLTLFDEMTNVGQPTGPSWVALPLAKGGVVRAVEQGGVVYDAARDGALAEGWVLVWFGREGDGRATDFPVAVYPNRAPERIDVAAGGGLAWTFGGAARNALTLLPLYGIRAVDTETTAGWTRAGALPAEVAARVRTWQARSRRLPLTVREFWQYLPERRAFELRQQFAYAEDLSEWAVKEELVAPLPLLLSNSEAAVRYASAGVLDLDYAVFQGGYHGVLGETAIRLELPEVKLEAVPPRLDRARLSASPLARKYLAELDALGLAGIFQSNMDRVMARPHFMPHIWPMIEKPDLFSGYELMTEEEQAAFVRRVEAGYADIIFSDAWRERLWPDKAPYLGSDFRYGNLTYPYGVAEPYYGVVEMLSKMNYFCAGQDDYRVMVRHWDRIKELTEIIWHGGFAQYRYDGGAMIGEALVGLVKGAEAAGDRKMQRRAMLRLAQHAASAAGYLEGGERLAKDRSWARRGMSPVRLGDVQQTTPTTASKIADGTLMGSDGMLYWDRGYGNPVVLRDHARAQVQAIEAKLDREIPEWFKETDHNFKRRDGMFRRFTVRALVLREPMATLERQAAGLRATLRRDVEFDAAVLIILLQRVQEDLDRAAE